MHTFLARIWDPKNWMSISSAPYYLFLWHSRKLATNSQNDDWCQLAPKENLRGFDENWMSESIISRSFILGLTNHIFFISSSIWTCGILNIKYLLFFSAGKRSWKNANKCSKFKIRHVQIDELPKTLKNNSHKYTRLFLWKFKICDKNRKNMW